MIKPFNSSLFLLKNIKYLQYLPKKQVRYYNSVNSIKSNSNNNNHHHLYYVNNSSNDLDLSPESIKIIRNKLSSCRKLTYKFNYATENTQEAAVLMPLCIANGKPSVLFTIRSMSLKTHTGEVSFPGGKRDLTDPSIKYTALRETYEEVGIHPSQIDILGQDSTMPNKDRTIRVYPFVGFIRHPIDINNINFSRDEVYGVFSVTLEDLLNQDKRRWERFRGSDIMYPVFSTRKEIGLEIWGLTAFILESVLRKISSPLRRNQ